MSKNFGEIYQGFAQFDQKLTARRNTDHGVRGFVHLEAVIQCRGIKGLKSVSYNFTSVKYNEYRPRRRTHHVQHPSSSQKIQQTLHPKTYATKPPQCLHFANKTPATRSRKTSTHPPPRHPEGPTQRINRSDFAPFRSRRIHARPIGKAYGQRGALGPLQSAAIARVMELNCIYPGQSRASTKRKKKEVMRLVLRLWFELNYSSFTLITPMTKSAVSSSFPSLNWK